MYRKIFILTILFIMVPAAIAVTEINMKTSDIYTAQYQTHNIDQDVLLNCVSGFVGDIKDEPWVNVKPALFDLQPEASQDIIIIFNRPPVGYYTDEFQIRCERYLDDEFLGVVSIISPSDQPVFNILVREAGEGMSYQILPINRYEFLAEGGEDKTAVFQIVNTGTVDLDITFIVPPEYSGIVFINPVATVVRINEVQKFNINVDVPRTFTGFETNITINIGDFEDQFVVKGQRESDVTGAAAAASVAFGSVDVGPLKIPVWILVITIIGGIIYIINLKPKKGGRK